MSEFASGTMRDDLVNPERKRGFVGVKYHYLQSFPLFGGAEVDGSHWTWTRVWLVRTGAIVRIVRIVDCAVLSTTIKRSTRKGDHQSLRCLMLVL